MKKIIVTTLSLLMVLCITSCSVLTKNRDFEEETTAVETESPTPTSEPQPEFEEFPSELIDFSIYDKSFQISLRTSFEQLRVYYNEPGMLLANITVGRIKEQPTKMFISIKSDEIQQNIPFTLIVEMIDEQGNVAETYSISDILVAYTHDNDPELEMAVINGESLQATTAITHFSDLSKFPGVRHLLLSGDGISGDVGELSGLPNLETLCLHWVRAEGDVSNLTGLKNLSLSSTTQVVFDLRKMSDLEYLEISNYLKYMRADGSTSSGTVEFDQLAGLSKLQTIKLDQIATVTGSLAPLANFNQLTKLVYDDCNEHSEEALALSDLEGMTSLEYLLLGSNVTGDLSSLYELTNLSYLYISQGLRKDITGSETDLLDHIHPTHGDLFYLGLDS